MKSHSTIWTFVITSLATAQDLYDLDEDVNGLKVMLDNPELAEVARALDFVRLTPRGLKRG